MWSAVLQHRFDGGAEVPYRAGRPGTEGTPLTTLLKTASLTIALLTAATTCFAAGPCCSASASCAVAATPDNVLTDQERAAGWRLLFDGKTTDGWACTDSNSKGWIIENGTIYYNRQGGGYFHTNDRFGNFEAKIDFMVDKRTNSGIFFRWDNLDDPVQTGIEMQLLDSAGRARPGKHDCGAIYDILEPSENAMKPALQWNTVSIMCRGRYITMTMNDRRIIRMDLDKYTEPHKNLDGTRNKFGTAYKDMPRGGHIGFQAHGGKVWFRNIKIRVLE